MSRNPHRPPRPVSSESKSVDAFLEEMARMPVVQAAPEAQRGRLLFAIDATASRQPTWDQAAHVQARMFEETARLGGLQVQLVYFRGYGEFHVSPWCDDPRALLARMTEVQCRSGLTQIERVLRHALAAHREARVGALVYVGDCMEEDPERLLDLAGRMGLEGVPAFLFHEGHDPLAAAVFRDIARLSGGACLPFDHRSPAQLAELLSAVAVYAAGGLPALEDRARHGAVAQRLLQQLRP